MRKTLMICVLAAVAMLFSCSGGIGTPSSGNVVLSATDDISSYKQVIITINKVQIINPGAAGSTCDVLTTPVTLNLSSLSSIIQLLNVLSCPSDSYNTIHIEFDKGMRLMDQDNTSAICSICADNICSIDIDRAFHVFGGLNNRLALDFNLMDFEVSDFSTENCSVKMKISSLSDSEIDLKKRTGYGEGMEGYISNPSASAKTFFITKGNKAFSVNYSQVSQQNIDLILQFALNNNLAVKIESSNIDLDAGSLKAAAIFVEVEGIISNLDTAKHTFTLDYDSNKNITVDYGNASSNNRVNGLLSNSVNIAAKLTGYDGKNYSAYQVEVIN